MANMITFDVLQKQEGMKCKRKSSHRIKNCTVSCSPCSFLRKRYSHLRADGGDHCSADQVKFISNTSACLGTQTYLEKYLMSERDNDNTVFFGLLNTVFLDSRSPNRSPKFGPPHLANLLVKKLKLLLI